jgi:hypothetical protein
MCIYIYDLTTSLQLISDGWFVVIVRYEPIRIYTPFYTWFIGALINDNYRAEWIPMQPMHQPIFYNGMGLFISVSRKMAGSRTGRWESLTTAGNDGDKRFNCLVVLKCRSFFIATWDDDDDAAAVCIYVFPSCTWDNAITEHFQRDWSSDRQLILTPGTYCITFNIF